MRIARPILTLIRLCVGIQLVMGIALWTGRGYQWVGIHRGIGLLLVFLLIVEIVIAAMRRVSAPVLALAVAWVLLLPALGMTQQRILPGDTHWIVRIIHLVVGVASAPIAAILVMRGEAAAKPTAA
jgi:hypothetical protein